MTALRRLTPLLLLAAAAGEARTFEQTLAWTSLPPDLAGKKVKVETTAGRAESGTVAQVTAEGLTLSAGRRGASRTIARVEIKTIEWRTPNRPLWTFIGAGIGAAPGALLTAWAVSMKRNEGGIYSNRNIGIAVGILGAGAAVGAIGGRAADADRHVIRIAGP